MIPAYQRNLHSLYRLFWLGSAVFVVAILVAMFFGVSTQTAGSQTFSPPDAVRNFPAILTSELKSLVGIVGPYIWLIFINLFSFVLLFWYMASGTTYTHRPGEIPHRFTDVRGQPEIVESVKHLMDIFQGYRHFKDKFGGYPPRGILFEGPPGTGKTLLAKAIAGETGVPFLYASGAGFANMFLGVPQLKVRMMFKKARKLASRWGGCVIFLDELDSIGGARSGVTRAFTGSGGLNMVMPGMGGGDSMLVNALLTEMDGMDRTNALSGLVRRMLHLGPAPLSSHNILVIGATNRAQTLDPALLRQGRFDRKIHVGVPGEDGRRDIIAYYLNKVAHVPIDIDRLAKETIGYTPVRIKTVINEGLIFAHREGRDALTYEDIMKAKLRDEAGLEEPVSYTIAERSSIALHEAGHAISQHYLDPANPVHLITIKKRGEALGMMRWQPLEERHGQTRDEMLSDIQVSLAGMVAEEIWLGQSSSGPGGDLQGATAIATAMITHYGMGSTLVSTALLQGRSQIEDALALALKDPEVRSEVNNVLQDCKMSVRRLLEMHRAEVEVVRDALLARREISGDEFRDLLHENGFIPKPPVNQIALEILPPTSGNGSAKVN